MYSIVIGFLLNVLIGEIPFITHPIIIIGNLINFLEKKLYKKNNKKNNGFILLILVSVISYLIPFSILKIINNEYLKIVIESLMILEILSIKGLKSEPMKVYKALKAKDIKKARFEISMLVSRDTKDMNKKQIIMSTVETVSENIVDGIIAPLFFIIIGGAPLGFFYKAVNTLDSMVGYKNEKYSKFGYYSAKFDDLLNFIPARITPLFIFLSIFILKFNFKEAIKVFKEDRKKSSSPNSGYSEAPIAGALEIYFGGKLKYFGKIIEKPKIGYKSNFEIEKIKDSINIMILTSVIGVISLLSIKYIGVIYGL